mgnify:CR=1 FL=1
MKKHNNNNNNTIYGINSSISVLKADACIVKNIFITKDSQAHKNTNIQNIIKKRHLSDKVSIINKTIDRSKRSVRSQGIMIEFLFLGLKYDFDSFLYSEKNDDCVLILDQLEDPQNLGQIIRTCECAGVNKIILTKDRSVSLSDTSLQISQGAFASIVFYVCGNLSNTLRLLKDTGYWLAALENSIEADRWDKINYKGKIGIILGSEGRGIRKLTLKNSDFIVTIPMQGKINSLNVSATCSAILFERLRQLSL